VPSDFIVTVVHTTETKYLVKAKRTKNDAVFALSASMAKPDAGLPDDIELNGVTVVNGPRIQSVGVVKDLPGDSPNPDCPVSHDDPGAEEQVDVEDTPVKRKR
jgi:hypothetical protein